MDAIIPAGDELVLGPKFSRERFEQADRLVARVDAHRTTESTHDGYEEGRRDR